MISTKTIYNSVLLCMSVFLISCGGIKNPQNFEYIKIGKQKWMVQNLNVNVFRNGDIITEIISSEDWSKAADEEMPAWSYYDNDLVNGKKYGKLYNWHAVNDPRGLCPEGWHVPSKDEVDELIDYLGGENVAGEKIKDTTGWGKIGNGTNSSGFTGLPGGGRGGSGTFFEIGNAANWWLSTKASVGNSSAWSMGLDSDETKLYTYENHKSGGYYVRCLKD